MRADNLTQELQAHQCLYEAVKDKRVVLVGGAETFDRDSLDQYDLVVRTNNHYLRQGDRVDWLYLGAGVMPAKLPSETRFLSYRVDYSMAQIDTTAVTLVPYHYRKKRATDYIHGLDWLDILANSLDTLPLTGIIAIAHIRSLRVSALHVTGFDFYQSDGSVPARRDSHDIPQQIEWLKRLLMCDKRISVDERLQKLLSSNYSVQPVQQETRDGQVVNARYIRQVMT